MIHVAFSIAFWTWFAISCAALFAVALAYLNPLWRLRVEGARAVDRRRAFAMVSNHQSFADILVLYAT